MDSTEERAREAEEAERNALFEWRRAEFAKPPCPQRDKIIIEIDRQLRNMSACAQSFRELITTQSPEQTRHDTDKKLETIATKRLS